MASINRHIQNIILSLTELHLDDDSIHKIMSIITSNIPIDSDEEFEEEEDELYEDEDYEDVISPTAIVNVNDVKKLIRDQLLNNPALWEKIVTEGLRAEYDRLEDIDVAIEDEIDNNTTEILKINYSDGVKVLTEYDLDKIKKMTYNNIQRRIKLKKNEKCKLCDKGITPISYSRIYAMLSCNHVYHYKCIYEHLSSKDYRCPTCKSSCGESTTKSV